MRTHVLEQMILTVRGQRVMLDSDLASLYGVTTKALNQAVRRNLRRFPADFMLELTAEEAGKRRSQIVTASFRNVRYRPLAFTEQGVAMLSSVLRSRRAVEVNVEIIRAFVRLREMLGAHVELARQLEQLEKKYDAQFRVVFDAIRELMSSGDPPKRPIGFHPPG